MEEEIKPIQEDENEELEEEAEEEIEVETIETSLTLGEIEELMSKLEALKQTKNPFTFELAEDLELTIHHEEDEE
ncbi:MAG: hypothetical protein ABIH92_02760 [Nanoarchaeota archaeon]